MSRNVDAAEIARFDQIAARWWDPDGEMAPLHVINPLRARYIEQAAGTLGGKTAVDIGCGGGLLTEALAARGDLVETRDLGRVDVAAQGRTLARHCCATAMAAGSSTVSRRRSRISARPATNTSVTWWRALA